MKFISDDLLDKLVVDLKEGYFYDTCITKSVIVANSNGIDIEVKRGLYKGTFLSKIDEVNEKDIKEMNKLVDKMDIAIKYEDYKEYYQLQTNFHRLYIEKSNNEKLLELLDSLKKIFIKKNYYKENSNSNINKALTKTNEEHKKIIKLIEKNKED